MGFAVVCEGSNAELLAIKVEHRATTIATVDLGIRLDQRIKSKRAFSNPLTIDLGSIHTNKTNKPMVTRIPHEFGVIP